MKDIITHLHKNILAGLIMIITLPSILLSCGEKIGPTEDNVMAEDDTYIDQKCSTCDFTISLTDYKFDGIEQGVKPGDTVGIEGGDRGGIWLKNVEGNGDKPIVFINCGGQVKITGTTSNGIWITNCKYFHLTGLGSKADKYGINVSTTMAGTHGLAIEQLSTNYEVDHIEINKAGYGGIVCRSDATCDGSISKSTFTQYNTILHHNYVHDTGGEGFYVGGSHWGSGQGSQPGCVGTILYEPELKGVRIYKNIVTRTGRDGIQIGSAVEDCKIYMNLISDYALNNDVGHMGGFQINPGTTGPLYDNVIIGGNGVGIFMLGRGDNTIYNNIIVNPKFSGIATGDRNPTPGVGFYIINNTIINSLQDGFDIYSNQTVGSVFYNNIVVNPQGDFLVPKTSNVVVDSSNNIFTYNISRLKFKDPDNNDFSLMENSPAINYGVDVSSYGIDKDFNGNPRPVDAYDAGAFEFQNK